MRFKRATLRYGDTPRPVTPFQKAAQAWDERIGSAEAKARQWRLAALLCLALSVPLASLSLYVVRSTTPTPLLVELDRNGAYRTSGPADALTPSDAQIAFTLARFIENVRSLSIDPVVVRQSWLRAYDFASERAAVTLTEYARETDPFANLGRLTVAVEIVSVVRASPTSFQLRWSERTYDNGVSRDVKRWTAMLTIVHRPPRTAELIAKNPLGIYVHALNWSQDLAGDGK